MFYLMKKIMSIDIKIRLTPSRGGMLVRSMAKAKFMIIIIINDNHVAYLYD